MQGGPGPGQAGDKEDTGSEAAGWARGPGQQAGHGVRGSRLGAGSGAAGWTWGQRQRLGAASLCGDRSSYPLMRGSQVGFAEECNAAWFENAKGARADVRRPARRLQESRWDVMVADQSLSHAKC